MLSMLNCHLLPSKMEHYYQIDKYVKDRAFYDTLGVTPDCSRDSIKKAFKKLALKYHPDKNPYGKSKFIKIAKSYKVLSSPELRRLYDLEGNNIFTHGYVSKMDHYTCDDILVTIALPASCLKNGCKLEFELNEEFQCTVCPYRNHKRAIMGSCAVCSGKGKVLLSQISNEDTKLVKNQYYSCKHCTGSHQPIIECIKCNGNGVVKKTHMVPVTLMEGVPSGYQFKLSTDTSLPNSTPQFFIKVQQMK